MKVKGLIMVIVMGILSALTGCLGKNPGTGNTEKLSSSEITPIPLPEGAHVTRLFTHRSGMAREMYYILCEKEDGIYMKMTYECPMWWDGADKLDYKESFFYGVDKVFDDEGGASAVKLTDEAPLREIEAVLEKYGALGWDGWNESRKLPDGILDADFSARTYIVLSDGTKVDMSGSNTAPMKWNDFHYEIEKIFTKSFNQHKTTEKGE